jgi:hypothetical protein
MSSHGINLIVNLTIMKKKFSLEIKTPCSENFNTMIPNQQGSFCNSCAKNVIDLSKKTNSEIAKFITETKDTNICARLKTTQLEEEFEYNAMSKTANLKYAVAVAASVLLTSNIMAQEVNSPKVETCESKPIRHAMGKIAYSETRKNMVSFTLKGKILEKGKPLSEKKYPNLVISVSGVSANVNPKTGEYSLPLTLDKNTKEVYVMITNDDRMYSKSIAIDLNKIKDNVMNITILIDSEKEMQLYKIAGGLGVNYIDAKKPKRVS